MRILLLNPSSTDTYQSVGVMLPPLGLLYIAAAVRHRGYDAHVVDQSVDKRTIDYTSFDVVGIHSDTTRFYKAMKLARQAKAAGAKVVMGGPHPCFCVTEVLESDVVDAIVRGEGEESFPDLLDAWKEGTDPSSIPGLILRTSDGNIDTGERQRIQDIDSLPFPARDLLDLSLYTKAHLGYRSLASIHTSRGCPHQCRFCSSSRFDGIKWRARSAESILAELEHLVHDMGYGAVAFLDDNFAGSPKRIHEICDGILKKNLDVHWWCFCRVDTIVRYPDMIRHMAEAGAYSVFVGVETPTLSVLDHLHKGINADQARGAIDILKQSDLEIWASYILGAPDETREDLRSTIRFACELDSDIAQFTLLTPYPGTDLFDELKEKNLDGDWSKYDAVHAVYKHPHISRFEMHLWLVRAYMSFYFRHRKSTHKFFRFLFNRHKFSHNVRS
jgi:anaerobic magnesium-protoporphyrin IX monomethyl ester cyclase